MAGRLRLAAAYTEQRMTSLLRLLDETTDTAGQPPFGGGSLSRDEFAALLLGNPEFQQQMAARMVFANVQEKAALKRAIERALEAVSAAPVQASPPEGGIVPPTPALDQAPAPGMPPGGLGMGEPGAST